MRRRRDLRVLAALAFADLHLDWCVPPYWGFDRWGPR